MVAFGASFARVGSGVSAGLDSDSTRTQHGQNTVAGQICPEHGTKQGWEGSRRFLQTFVSSRSVVPERNHLSLNNEELRMPYYLG